MAFAARITFETGWEIELIAGFRVKEQVNEGIQYFIEQMILARHRHFGVSSEQGQGRLFDEAEVLVLDTSEAQDIAPLPAAAARVATPPVVKARVEIVHDVHEVERTCPCGTPMVEIGQDVSEQLDIVPMQIRVLRHRVSVPRQTLASLPATRCNRCTT